MTGKTPGLHTIRRGVTTTRDLVGRLDPPQQDRHVPVHGRLAAGGERADRDHRRRDGQGYHADVQRSVDGDTPTYSITNAPDHGTLSGTGANRPAPTRRTPTTPARTSSRSRWPTASAAPIPRRSSCVRPPGDDDHRRARRSDQSTTASFEFEAQAGTTFACNFDGLGYQPCTSPASYTGVAEDSYTFDAVRRRATVVEDVAAHRDITVDTTEPDKRSRPVRGGLDVQHRHADVRVQLDRGRLDVRVQHRRRRVRRLRQRPRPSIRSPTGSTRSRVQAIDPAGNMDSAARHAHVDERHDRADTEIVDSPPSADNSNSADFEFDSADETATFSAPARRRRLPLLRQPEDLPRPARWLAHRRVRAVDPRQQRRRDAGLLHVDDRHRRAGHHDRHELDLATQDDTGDFTFTSTEAGTSSSATVDGGDAVDGDGGSFTHPTLEDGQHVFTSRRRRRRQRRRERRELHVDRRHDRAATRRSTAARPMRSTPTTRSSASSRTS